jgi:hypothetical protein
MVPILRSRWDRLQSFGTANNGYLSSAVPTLQIHSLSLYPPTAYPPCSP